MIERICLRISSAFWRYRMPSWYCITSGGYAPSLMPTADAAAWPIDRSRPKAFVTPDPALRIDVHEQVCHRPGTLSESSATHPSGFGMGRFGVMNLNS